MIYIIKYNEDCELGWHLSSDRDNREAELSGPCPYLLIVHVSVERGDSFQGWSRGLTVGVLKKRIRFKDG
jgi:hypothetical protein